ncbi:MAG: FAD-binding protein, partial [Bacillota bacterium]
MQKIVPAWRLLFEEPLAAHTTFKIGGPAECMILPMTIEEVRAVCLVAKNYNVPIFILGGGSNLLVRDNGIAGIVLKLSPDCFGRIEKTADGLRAYAGAWLKDVCAFAAAHSLTGIEFACGIPGSMGGAVYMNAGAYDGELSGCVQSVMVLMPDGTIAEILGADADFSYRHSIFQTNGAVILAVELQLVKTVQSEVVAKMRE